MFTIMWTVILLSALLIATTCGQHVCPDGWHGHEGSCYLFVHEPYNWFDAEVMCQFFKSTLVEINSRDENDYVAGLYHDQYVSYGWMGLNDIVEEGVFRFSDMSKPSETFWYPGMPDDYAHLEDCAAMYVAQKMWGDWHCETVTFPSVCEKNSSALHLGPGDMVG